MTKKLTDRQRKDREVEKLMSRIYSMVKKYGEDLTMSACSLYLSTSRKVRKAEKDIREAEKEIKDLKKKKRNLR